MNWWKRHVDHTVHYAKAANKGDRGSALDAASQLFRGVDEWVKIIGRHPYLVEALMAEHVVAAKLYADDPAASSVAAAMLSRNADLQAMIYAASIPKFPLKKFKSLMAEHLRLTAAYIDANRSGNGPAFEKAVEAAKTNAQLLDAFTHGELFPS